MVNIRKNPRRMLWRAIYQPLLVLFLVTLMYSCKRKDNRNSDDNAQQVQADDRPLDKKIAETIQFKLTKPQPGDLINPRLINLLHFYYSQNGYMPVWSKEGIWNRQSNELIQYLDTCIYDGLFNKDYHYKAISTLKNKLANDSLKMMKPVDWALADLGFTSAFMQVLQDLAQGRLFNSKQLWSSDSSKYESFFLKNIHRFMKGEKLAFITNSIQPTHKGYVLLRGAIRSFTDSMDRTVYTYLQYPYPSKDSLLFIKALKKRFAESGIFENTNLPDTTALQDIIKKYQAKKQLKTDGKISSSLVRMLNNTGKEKLIRIAITLDKFKQLPAVMPDKYIWVNLPSFYLQLIGHDTVLMQSKIICGKSSTPTPEITSYIDNLVTFPTWTVPKSIIEKEILPGLKRNPGYLARKGLGLYKHDGTPVNPYSVNWEKFTKGIPFKVMQSSGDENALGVMKFNFKNAHDVYLHDTNQRYLFKKNVRNLSHGCVRVQDWEQLAFYIARNDSSLYPAKDTLKYTTDSISNWIRNEEMHKIVIKNKFPIFIRYFSCAYSENGIRFYDDIYGSDIKLREKYFALK